MPYTPLLGVANASTADAYTAYRNQLRMVTVTVTYQDLFAGPAILSTAEVQGLIRTFQAAGNAGQSVNIRIRVHDGREPSSDAATQAFYDWTTQAGVQWMNYRSVDPATPGKAIYVPDPLSRALRGMHTELMTFLREFLTVTTSTTLNSVTFSACTCTNPAFATPHAREQHMGFVHLAKPTLEHPEMTISYGGSDIAADNQAEWDKIDGGVSTERRATAVLAEWRYTVDIAFARLADVCRARILVGPVFGSWTGVHALIDEWAVDYPQWLAVGAPNLNQRWALGTAGAGYVTALTKAYKEGTGCRVWFSADPLSRQPWRPAQTRANGRQTVAAGGTLKLFNDSGQVDEFGNSGLILVGNRRFAYSAKNNGNLTMSEEVSVHDNELVKDISGPMGLNRAARGIVQSVEHAIRGITAKLTNDGDVEQTFTDSSRPYGPIVMLETPNYHLRTEERLAPFGGWRAVSAEYSGEQWMLSNPDAVDRRLPALSAFAPGVLPTEDPVEPNPTGNVQTSRSMQLTTTASADMVAKWFAISPAPPATPDPDDDDDGGGVDDSDDGIRTSILSTAPWAYWPLDEEAGSIFHDLSGDTRDATISGTLIFADPDSETTGGVSVDIEAGTGTAVYDYGEPLTWTDFSVTFRLKPESLVDYNQQVLSLNATNDLSVDGWGAFLFHAATSESGAFVGTGQNDVTGRFIPSETTGLLAVGTWVDFTFTYEGGAVDTAKVYKNGVLLATKTGIVGPNAFRYVQLFAGHLSTVANGVDGKVQHVALWDRLLSAGEVSAMHNGTPVVVDPGDGGTDYPAPESGGSPVEIGVGITVVAHVIKQFPDQPSYPLRATRYVDTDFWIREGVPVDRPPIAVENNVLVSANGAFLDNTRPRPEEIETGATARWLASEYAGERWYPVGSKNVWWETSGSYAPIPRSNYTYFTLGTTGAEQIELPSIYFNGDADHHFWSNFGPGATASEFSMIMVASAHQESRNDLYYGLLESGRAPTEPLNDLTRTQVMLRKDGGYLTYGYEGEYGSYRTSTQSASWPAIYGISATPESVRFYFYLLYEKWRAEVVRSDQLIAYDLSLLLGRASKTMNCANMDLFEVNYYSKRLSVASFDYEAKKIASAYGSVL